MRSEIKCACGNLQALEHARTAVIQDAEWEADGWEKVGEAWTCWQCLGKPMPAAIVEAMRDQEIDELIEAKEGQDTPAESIEEVLDGLDLGGQGTTEKEP